MNRYYKIGYCVLTVILFIGIIVYGILFYPQQSMPIGIPVTVTTPDTAKYHNDCLHPCIRYDKKSGKYHMAQSPYYGWDSKVENPMFYKSEDYMLWHNGQLIADTPEKGFNSDPNIYIDKNGTTVFIWRECYTPLCDSLGCFQATVGGMLKDGKLQEKHVYAINSWTDGDTEQCPIMIEHDGNYYIYAAWYQYEPERKNKGIAIWKGTSLENPDFQLIDTIPFKSVYTCDKAAKLRVLGRYLYFPKPQYHDMWHFDLFEYDNKLYMVSAAERTDNIRCEERGDNIMLSVADDWVHFRTYRTPLVNNHYTENYCGYRQYYYKPTAFVKDDTLHLFYTANADDDANSNQLYHTAAPIKKILR